MHTHAHQDTMPPSQDLQPHCLCPRPSKLSCLTDAPYLVAQVSSDMLLHQVPQLLGGTGEGAQRVFLGTVGMALGRVTQTSGTEVCPQSAAPRSPLRHCHAPDYVRAVVLTPTEEELESQRKGPSSQGLEVAKMVVAGSRPRRDRRQTLDLAKAPCDLDLSQLTPGLLG